MAKVAAAVVPGGVDVAEAPGLVAGTTEEEEPKEDEFMDIPRPISWRRLHHFRSTECQPQPTSIAQEGKVEIVGAQVPKVYLSNPGSVDLALCKITPIPRYLRWALLNGSATGIPTPDTCCYAPRSTPPTQPRSVSSHQHRHRPLLPFRFGVASPSTSNSSASSPTRILSSNLSNAPSIKAITESTKLFEIRNAAYPPAEG
ncbi:hypothetical protein BDN72DRAFT_895944 [Pluteus cervinus]|uniref:Uncharacterized protein n=1 Tax=Pluteus cervinus TaxID=181527 RepID=A0ACD3AZB2_9AGAR|nr:hypothetical protein BDN72DRAFT_895944 [Pluteus cervinus]